MSLDWWALGAFTGSKRLTRHPGARRKELPSEFDGVVFQAVQIGDGVTAVVATFHTVAAAAGRVDTQRRRSMHHAARRFLAQTCPGLFAAGNEPQPLLELTSDKLADGEPSAELPAMELQRMPVTEGSYLEEARTWLLRAKRQAIIDQARSRGQKFAITDEWSIISYVGEAIGDYVLRVSISELLCAYHSQYAQIRDRAPRRRGSVRMKHMREQRANLLVLSVNVRTTERAITQFNERKRPPACDLLSSPPMDTDEHMASDQHQMLVQLRADDEQFRDLLSAAVSLTSSIQSLRASRVARWIAAASLVTSLLLVMLGDGTQHPRVATLVQWFLSQ